MAFYKRQNCSVSYPGLEGVDTANYTYNQGVEPDEISVVVKVEPLALRRYGDFVFRDGEREYTVPDCRVERILPNFSRAGNSWQIILKDHRWRWENAVIDGDYNQQDTHQNLLPGRVKTPRELVKIALLNLGEQGFDVSLMPEGVKEGDVPPNEFPGAGEGVKSTKPELNPRIEWNGTPTREALARLCDQFYMVPIWCNIERRVRIEKRSVGAELPTDYVDSGGGAINLPPIPAGVGVRGAPIRWQFRVVLDAVAPDHGSQLNTIDILSYAPVNPPRPGEVQVFCDIPFLTGENFRLLVDGWPFSVVGTTDATQVLNDMAAAINANSSVGSRVAARVEAGPALYIAGRTNGHTPDVRRGDNLATFTVNVTTVGVQTAWEFCNPPIFPGVHATDQLTFNKAMELAQAGVYKMYRVTLLDPSRGPTDPQQTLYVRRYGHVLDLHSMVPFNSRVEQVVPTERDPNRIRGGSGDIIADVPDYYDGWSRDRSSECYGAIYHRHSSPVHRKLDSAQLNTEFKQRIEVPFTFDPGSYVVTFASPVLEVVPAGNSLKVQIPRIVFEFSAYLRDRETHEILRYRRWVKFADEKGEIGDKRQSPKKLARKDNDAKAYIWDKDPQIKWFEHDDVVRTWVQRYGVDNAKRRHLFTESIADEYDNATAAADKYLDEHLNRIVLEGGTTIHYKGVPVVKLDGAIGQMTIDFGREAMGSTLSRNVEHDHYIPNYDTRRFREAIRPDAEAARQNREFSKPALIGNVFAAMAQGRIQRNG